MKPVIELSILQEHIDSGKRGCPLKCPIGQALSDIEYPQHTVGDAGVQIRGRNWTADYSMDETGQRFVKDVDKGIPVFPCVIVLKLKAVYP